MPLLERLTWRIRRLRPGHAKSGRPHSAPDAAKLFSGLTAEDYRKEKVIQDHLKRQQALQEAATREDKAIEDRQKSLLERRPPQVHLKPENSRVLETPGSLHPAHSPAGVATGASPPARSHAHAAGIVNRLMATARPSQALSFEDAPSDREIGNRDVYGGAGDLARRVIQMPSNTAQLQSHERHLQSSGHAAPSGGVSPNSPKPAERQVEPPPDWLVWTQAAHLQDLDGSPLVSPMLWAWIMGGRHPTGARLQTGALDIHLSALHTAVMSYLTGREAPSGTGRRGGEYKHWKSLCGHVCLPFTLPMTGASGEIYLHADGRFRFRSLVSLAQYIPFSPAHASGRFYSETFGLSRLRSTPWRVMTERELLQRLAMRRDVSNSSGIGYSQAQWTMCCNIYRERMTVGQNAWKYHQALTAGTPTAQLHGLPFRAEYNKRWRASDEADSDAVAAIYPAVVAAMSHALLWPLLTEGGVQSLGQ